MKKAIIGSGGLPKSIIKRLHLRLIANDFTS